MLIAHMRTYILRAIHKTARVQYTGEFLFRNLVLRHAHPHSRSGLTGHTQLPIQPCTHELSRNQRARVDHGRVGLGLVRLQGVGLLLLSFRGVGLRLQQANSWDLIIESNLAMTYYNSPVDL